MKNSKSGSSMETDSLGVRRTEDQEEKDAENRRKTLMVVLDIAEDTDDLVRLVSMLELGAELAELAGGDQERHRRLAAAQAQLDEASELALAELARSRAERH